MCGKLTWVEQWVYAICKKLKAINFSYPILWIFLSAINAHLHVNISKQMYNTGAFLPNFTWKQLSETPSSVMSLIGLGSQQCWAYVFHQLLATKFLTAKQVVLNGTNGTNATWSVKLIKQHMIWWTWFDPGANQLGHRNILTNSIWLHHRRFPSN